MLRLSSELAKKHISKISIAAWTTADLSRLGLPDFQLLPPAQPVTGWVAISVRSQRMGDAFHSSYGPKHSHGCQAIDQLNRLGARFVSITSPRVLLTKLDSS